MKKYVFIIVALMIPVLAWSQGKVTIPRKPKTEKSQSQKQQSKPPKSDNTKPKSDNTIEVNKTNMGDKFFHKAAEDLLKLRSVDQSRNSSVSELDREREKQFDDIIACIQQGIDKSNSQSQKEEAKKILNELKLHKKPITRVNRKYKDPEAEGIAYIETYARALEKLCSNNSH